MRRALSMCGVVCCLVNSLLAQDKCNLEIVNYTDRHLVHLSVQDIGKFLATFDSSCSINVEYSEYSNELLFKLLDHYPATIVDLLAKGNKLDTAYILGEFSQPVIEVDIDRLRAKVGAVREHSNTRLRLLYLMPDGN